MTKAAISLLAQQTCLETIFYQTKQKNKKKLSLICNVMSIIMSVHDIIGYISP